VTVRTSYALGCAACGLELSSTESNVLAEAGNGWAKRLCKARVTPNFKSCDTSDVSLQRVRKREWRSDLSLPVSNPGLVIRVAKDGLEVASLE
jgi:hypothetical protein